MPTIYTIGFSGKTQDSFLEVLGAVGVKTLADIRAWRMARFVPWASGANLMTWVPRSSRGMTEYKYIPELSPTKELLSAYKDGAIDWAGYEKVFNGILAERQVEKLFTTTPSCAFGAIHPFASEGELSLCGICFLCSEKTADKCHRRLVVEYLARHFPDVKIVHL